MDPDITPLGITTGRYERPFGIRQADRRFHMYLIGRTGTGKSTLLKNICLSDIEAGRGFLLLDPHGDLADSIYHSMAPIQRENVVYLDATDPNQPYGYNPLRHVRSDKIPLAASGIMEVFQKLWSDAWGQRMEHILRNALYAILEQHEGTLADVPRLLRDKAFRQQIVPRLKNRQVRDYWQYEYEKYSYRLRADGIVPIQNKIGAFLTDPRLARILLEPKKPLSFRKLMDEGTVVLVNLAKGTLGSDSSNLLGALLVTTVGMAAYSRSDMPEADRTPYTLAIDEFQNFTTKSVAEMTSELRKFGCQLLLANQYLSQVDREVKDSILANMGSIICFRIGPGDCNSIAKELYPTFRDNDILNLPNYHIYLKIMLSGALTKPFSARTIISKSELAVTWSK